MGAGLWGLCKAASLLVICHALAYSASQHPVAADDSLLSWVKPDEVLQEGALRFERRSFDKCQLEQLSKLDHVPYIIFINCSFPDNSIEPLASMPSVKSFDFYSTVPEDMFATMAKIQSLESFNVSLSSYSQWNTARPSELQAIPALNKHLKGFGIEVGIQPNVKLIQLLLANPKLTGFSIEDPIPGLPVRTYENLLLMDELRTVNLSGWEQLSDPDRRYVKIIMEVAEARAQRRSRAFFNRKRSKLRNDGAGPS
ncbi:hypothetical protein [Stratiformator vulcanicus]|uniref:Uncharacterized protein n=1 Tax=Stratiformator vulcanicus TaxID=2527980 RepID=A0A517QVZ5_9PLAN|nr:hypothetical protein [Stratiformator vulcanicus]QDT35832.1 hypothetical protein Pan189_01850 [Stratiformator vulcanicus]